MSCKIAYSDQLTAHNIHSHIHYELLYVTEGEVLMLIGERRIPVSAGGLVFLNQFDEHATRMVGDVYRRYYLLIPPTQLRAFQHDVRLLSVLRYHGSQFPYVLQTGAAKPRFDRYFGMLLDTWNSGGEYRDERIEALLTLILTDAYAIAPGLFSMAGGSTLLPVQEILDELDQSFDREFSLKELAGRYHVSPGCLSSTFRKYVGMSPMHYVTQSRLNRAKQLLMGTEAPVSEIAGQCGFRDVSNFVRRFRQSFRCTPLQFRQHSRNAAEPIARTEDG